jgi:hypothetical protein
MEIRPIESRSSSIVLCAVTQQIQPKLAVTLAQCRERFLNDPMVGGYSSLLTSMPISAKYRKAIGHPSPKVVPARIPAIDPSCIRYTSAAQQARWFERNHASLFTTLCVHAFASIAGV